MAGGEAGVNIHKALGALVLLAPGLLLGQTSSGTKSPEGANGSGAEYRAVLNRYCVTCHNERLKTAGLLLDKLAVENPSASPEIWEKVVTKLRTAAMPPAGVPRPDNATYNSFASYLEMELDRAAAANLNVGRPAAHRLNRAEYTNAIRDLLAIDIEGKNGHCRDYQCQGALLPVDQTTGGFDNIASALSVSPMLMERYMSSARLIAREAVGDPAIRPAAETYNLSKLFIQDGRISEALPFGSRGGIAFPYNFPLDGEYTVRIHLQKNNMEAIFGLGAKHKLDIRVDGVRVKQFIVGGTEGTTVGVQGAQMFYLKDGKQMEADAELEARFSMKAGTRQVGITFVDQTAAPEGTVEPSVATLHQFNFEPTTGQPEVGNVTITGPFNARGAGETPSRQKIFVCHPALGKDQDACAKRILSILARRAYRRPATDADVQHLLGVYRAGKEEDGFEAGIQAALEGILVSPKFLFRVEHDPASAVAGKAYRIGDLDLASRLSFFLWSSIPDNQLLDLAEKNKLREPAVLEQQVRRMLADDRSHALAQNFAGQWLHLRSVESAAPNSYQFGEFDENLRSAFEQETELFFESMIGEDRSVLDLLSAKYTFVNERLARFYGIPNIYGNRFRRVTLTDDHRMGLLGKGSILITTSYPNRTSPVLRGKFVLENIMGTPPPPPPPNVPALKETEDTKVMTMRQRMEQHRANPVCATCHARMDPLGFALDNFDAIGKWRTTEGPTPIDASGVLPDGTKFEGVSELQKILLSHPEQFVATATEKMLTYALGRELEHYDRPVQRKILRDAASDNYRWSTIVMGIVTSAPFQMRMPLEPTNTAELR